MGYLKPAYSDFKNLSTLRVEHKTDFFSDILLEKIYTCKSLRIVKDYFGNIEYSDDVLEAIYHTEGRVTPTGNPTDPWQYEYTIKDHLGNGRVYWTWNEDMNQPQVLQTEDYYPFGMLMPGRNYNPGSGYRFGFNGKEMDSEFVIMGELSLDGSIQSIKGALPIAIQARKEGFKGLILPKQNAREAAIVSDLEVYGVENVKEVADFLNGKIELKPTKVSTREEFYHCQKLNDFDFCDVKGQHNIKRALEIAASGGHNLILIGPPGAGKTMLAKRLPTILPPLSLTEALETTKIHSVAGKLNGNGSLVHHRPFRSPHHTISDVALVGGGTNPAPGEISMAHNGVLFLDELPEFKRTVLEVMRQPMEERKVTISRARVTVDYPANFMLVASMNPCPCGYYNHPEKECVCAPGIVQKYLNKISGPLLDRIDLHVEVTPVALSELSSKTQYEKSDSIRERVIEARKIQFKRFEKSKLNIHANAQMSTKLTRQICEIDKPAQELLNTVMTRLQLSARAYDRILKVSRTIADLAKSENITTEHLAEAIQFRSLDRENWAG